MDELKKFFAEERKRIFEPGPFFTQRVMARLDQAAAQGNEIWDVVPSSARPVFALALMLMLCFVFVEVFLPQIPQRGLIESYLETDTNTAQSFLFTEGELPTSQEMVEQILDLEEGQQ